MLAKIPELKSIVCLGMTTKPSSKFQGAMKPVIIGENTKLL